MPEKIILAGLGHSHPKQTIPNDFFDGLQIDSSAQWVEDRTGIQSRRSVLSKDLIQRLRHKECSLDELREQGLVPLLTELVKEPWDMALSRLPQDGLLTSAFVQTLDLLLCGTSIPDFYIPANASMIAKELRLSCTAFDVNSACSSFVTNLFVARSVLLSSAYSRVAIFNPERYTLSLDYEDKKSCVLFGDGSSCALLLKTSDQTLRGLELLDVILHSDPSGAEQITIPVGACFHQNGAAVQKFAVGKTLAVTHEILEKNSLRVQDLRYFLGHQANLRMLKSVAEKLGLTEEQHLFNVDLYGNQGAAGAPAVLSSSWEKYRKGDLILVAVVGSGLTWGSALFRCQ
ncbi:MAG: ketoacyl-ACP synthase III [Oligoflexales bacterium]|nr:ketoacyl-ACP synthase III [Oligoflexales bacterium]